MNIQDRKQRVSIWVRVAILAAAICISPNSLTHAQDFEAVQRRLLSAVKAGELSADQAKTMMAALERSKEAKSAKDRKRPTGKASGPADRKRRYRQAAEEIQQAVKSGKISKEQAQEKLNSLKKEIAGGQKQRKKTTDQGEAQADMKRRYLQAAKEIQQAVEAGKISKEQAQEKLNSLKKEIAGGQKQRKKTSDKGKAQADMKRRYLQAAEEIKQAVEAGKISKEDAKEKVLQLRKELFPNAK